MDGFVGLTADSLTTPRGQRDGIIYGDLGQVQVRVDDYHLFEVVVKPITIVDTTLVEVRLGGMEGHHIVDFYFLCLLPKGSQFYC